MRLFLVSVESGIAIEIKHASKIRMLDAQMNRALLPTLSITIPSTGLAKAEMI